jgi:hypothetical protein
MSYRILISEIKILLSEKLSTVKAVTVNQHYIPRLLLRRFSKCENPEAKSKRRVYKAFEVRNSSVEEKDIRDIAAEDYFFERDIVDGYSVELALGVKEDRYGKLLEKIESQQTVQRSQGNLITDLVSNLSFRTENHRIEMSRLLADTISWAREEAIADRPFYKKVERKALDLLAHEYGRGLGREKMAQARFLCRNSIEFKEKLAKAIDLLPEVTKLAELKFIAESYEVAQKAQCSFIAEKGLMLNQALSSIKWHIEQFDDSMILGDVGPISYCAEEMAYMPLMWALMRNSINHVVLPISKSTVLIGKTLSCSQELLEQQITSLIVNSASASLSHSFFVAESREVGTVFSAHIGSMNGNYNSKWVKEKLTYA